MSAPATHRVPTPGDLARRTQPTPKPSPRPVTPAGTTASGPAPSAARVALPVWNLRQDFQQGMRISRMRPEARLVALTLLGYANFQTGLLNKYAPSPKDLSYATGLTEGQVDVQITVLTQRGWLTHRTPRRGPRQGQPVVQLRVPDLVLEQLRRRRATES